MKLDFAFNAASSRIYRTHRENYILHTAQTERQIL